MKTAVLFLTFAGFFRSAGANAETIVIFGNEARPPKIWKEGGEPKGILVDALRAVEKDLGVTFKFELLPLQRAIVEATDKKGGIVGFSKNKERLAIFDYSDTVYNDDVILVTKKGKEFKFDSVADLQGKTLSAQRGASYGTDYEEAKKAFQLHESTSPVASLKMVFAGRADAAVVSPGQSALKELLKSPELTAEKDGFSTLAKPLAVSPNSLAFHKDMKMTGFLSKFNAAIKKKIDSGEMQAIVKKYE